MSSIDLARAKAMLNLWLEAEVAVAQGRSYTIGSRSLTRNSIKEIRDAQAYWSQKVQELESGQSGIKVRYLSPVGF